MNRIRRICRCLAGLPRRAGVLLASAAAAPAVLAASPGGNKHPALPARPCTGRCPAGGGLSFRRIVDIPFDACLAALDSWQRTGQDGGPHPGQGLWRGPIKADRDTCSIQVRLARGPLRTPLLIDRLSPARTALELIPSQRARPTTGYFRAGHRLLDSVTCALPAAARHAPRTTSARPRPADAPPPQPAPEASVPGSPQAAAGPAAQAAPSLID
jgi:hypothetical protein